MAVNPETTDTTRSKIATALKGVRDRPDAHHTHPMHVWSRNAFGGGYEYNVERRSDAIAGPGWRPVARLTDGDGWRVFLYLDYDHGIHDEREAEFETLDAALRWLVNMLNRGIPAPAEDELTS